MNVPLPAILKWVAILALALAAFSALGGTPALGDGWNRRRLLSAGMGGVLGLILLAIRVQLFQIARLKDGVANLSPLHGRLDLLAHQVGQMEQHLAAAATAGGSGDGRYRMPLFLMRPPADPALPFRFAPPTLAEPVSQLCTHEQFLEPAYARWCTELAAAPDQHRKQWEFCYILAVLDAAGLLVEGKRGLGFGTGREPLPSIFARRGIAILATDAPAGIATGHGWSTTGQHSQTAADLHIPAIVSRERFLEQVSWREVDMNAIPRDLDGSFDFCWSACCFEHLGSLNHGLDFVASSLRCLRPGGLAVHTTEFNLSSNDRTLEHPQLVLFRRADIERLMLRLIREGHEVWPLNLHPGFREVDEIVDLPPFGRPHLKLALEPYVATSFGLVVRRKA